MDKSRTVRISVITGRSDRLFQDLMREFKQGSFHKFPRTVVILDAEMKRVADAADVKTGGFLERLKGAFKKR